MYGISLVAATVADMFDTLDIDGENGIPQPSYVTMGPAGAVGLQFSSSDEVRKFLAYFGHTATTTLTGADNNRKVITEGMGTWTTSYAELSLNIYSVTDLEAMTTDDSGTDRLIVAIEEAGL